MMACHFWRINFSQPRLKTFRTSHNIMSFLWCLPICPVSTSLSYYLYQRAESFRESRQQFKETMVFAEKLVDGMVAAIPIIVSSVFRPTTLNVPSTAPGSPVASKPDTPAPWAATVRPDYTVINIPDTIKEESDSDSEPEPEWDNSDVAWQGKHDNKQKLN